MTTEDGTTTTDTGRAPSRPQSILARIAERREEIVNNLHLDLPVPRWTDPEIVVRYRPVEHAVVRSKEAELEKAKPNKRPALEVDLNADLLIRYCVGVAARIDGQEYSLGPDPKGDLTRFDPDLAAALRLPEDSSAREVVRSLFVTDGDLLSAARALVEWSGYQEAQADEALEGES